MKKIILCCLLIGFIFTSCKDDEPRIDNGIVSLDIENKTIHYKETFVLKPSYVGNAQQKKYEWMSNNEGIVTVRTVTGGYGEVTGNRVGNTTVKHYSTDGTVYAECNVTIAPKTELLKGIYYKQGANVETVKNQLGNHYTEIDGEVNSTGKDALVVEPLLKNLGYYRLIFEFENGKLQSTLVILDNTDEMLQEAEQYIEERFAQIEGSISGGIHYYDAGVSEFYDATTIVGIFLENANLGYPLGVKYTTK